MLQKWFPDKTGPHHRPGGRRLRVRRGAHRAGRPVADRPEPRRCRRSAFLPLGIAYLVMSLVGASFFRNPPAGLHGAGLRAAGDAGRRPAAASDYTQGEALRTPQWYLLTAILTLNVSAGIALISQAKGSATDIAGYSAAAAATLVGVLAVFNGAGRIVWAAASDYIGRMPTFAAMLGLQGVCLMLLPARRATRSSSSSSPRSSTSATAAASAPCRRPRATSSASSNAGAIYGLMLDRLEPRRRHRADHRLGADRRGPGLHARLHDDRHHRAGRGGADVHHQGARGTPEFRQHLDHAPWLNAERSVPATRRGCPIVSLCPNKTRTARRSRGCLRKYVEAPNG